MDPANFNDDSVRTTSLNELSVSRSDIRLLEDFSEELKQSGADFSSCFASQRKAYALEELLTKADVQSFDIGVGEHVLANDVYTAIESARSEVLFVTCFWAKSTSQARLSLTLKKLASDLISQKLSIEVNICFSSLSLWQKLFHTQAKEGQYWPPEKYASKFGLPDQSELLSDDKHHMYGVRLNVKSRFFRPFSVMHPKFVIVDRKHAFLPSCNVSWENWFEGCLHLQGDVVSHFWDFYRDTWDSIFYDYPKVRNVLPNPYDSRVSGTNGNLLSNVDLGLEAIPTIFLPSPHCTDAKFRPFWFQASPPPPPTPLNLFLLTAFDNAKQDVYIQTPNLTSPPVLTAILDALARGINITIVTSSRMMILEQLVTAGTVTELCVRRLIGRYRTLVQQHETSINQNGLEEGRRKPGLLTVQYFQSSTGSDTTTEPVKSHLKLTIIDRRIVVLGSGNLDRASWYTSQELGLAFFSAEMAEKVRENVMAGLEGRLGAELVSG